ncbi:MAG: hypothetical protein KDA87_17900 [Planctomycetales bacterium]|nr:hypothetical protein [Planctomycetales bacterium]
MKSQVNAMWLSVDDAEQYRKTNGINVDIAPRSQATSSYLKSAGVHLKPLNFRYFAWQAKCRRYLAVIAIARWEGLAEAVKIGCSICRSIFACSRSNLLVQKTGELSVEVNVAQQNVIPIYLCKDGINKIRPAASLRVSDLPPLVSKR